MKIKIIVADDHEMVREGLEVLIGKIPDVEIIGKAVNGEELVALTRQLMPDVILTDIKMPRMSGTEAIQIIKQDLPHIGVVVLSSFDEESLIRDALKAGARGYLLKNAGKEELKDTINAVYKDEPYYCKQIKIQLGDLVARGDQSRTEAACREHFTEREREVIGLICEGLSSKQIAAKLALKTRSVERYRDTIMTKMDVANAAGVVMFAVKHGLCNPATESR